MIFHDGPDDEPFHNEGPDMHHFRSSSYKEQHQQLKNIWEKVIENYKRHKISLPLQRIKTFDKDGKVVYITPTETVNQKPSTCKRKLFESEISNTETEDKEMNSVLIPDIYRLMSGPYHSIASFTTLCEELEDHIDPTIDEVRMEKMISIMKRLRDYKTDEVFPKMNELFYMLTETVFSLVESQENWSLSESDKPSVARMILDKFQKMIVGGRILPQQTLTEKKCHKRYKQVREYKEVQDLEKLIENHEKIYQELQEQQKKCKVINDKVTFVTDLLQRKKTFFAEYEDKFSPKNHERRKDYIKFLQEKLERNMEKAAETTGKYQTLLYAESVAKDKVRQ
ncbi:Hypothetical predicted protein, partial [Mytilus galloprovincialis]